MALTFTDENGVIREVSSNHPLPTTGNGGAGGATLAEQQSQTSLLDDIKANTGNITACNTGAVSLAGHSVYYTGSASAKADVKTAAGTLRKLWGENKTQETRYVQIFNALAANVTLGTTAPAYVVPVAAAGFFDFELNISHSTAISYAVTDTENGNTTAAISLNIAYQ